MYLHLQHCSSNAVSQHAQKAHLAPEGLLLTLVSSVKA
jgi:hypothetical protein